MLKLHADFIEGAEKAINSRLPSIVDTIRGGLLNDIIFLSRMGIAPEGADYGSVHSVPIPPPPTPQIPASPLTPSTVVHPESGFKLSQRSLNELTGVIGPLQQCVKLAIKYSLVDFRVEQGARTIEEQRDAMRRGTTQTMKSKHLPDANEVVRAVDLTAWVDGKVSWEFDYYYYIARAMDRAATELGYASHIRWGCVWDRVLSDFGVTAEMIAAQKIDDLSIKEQTRKLYLAAIESYKVRHAVKDFLDGPHFEWV